MRGLRVHGVCVCVCAHVCMSSCMPVFGVYGERPCALGVTL